MGYNQRQVVIIGAGKLGQRVGDTLKMHPELGLQVRGYLTRNAEKVGQMLEGTPVIGTFDQASDILTSNVDIVFLCLPPEVECETKD